MCSVNSVGEYTARRFCVFREFRGRTYSKKVLCKSVKSVGEHTARRFCVNLCNLWENIQQEGSV
ncbi:zinc-finger domain-containing protein [Leyella stercorea]|uniref:zinc-finger domain-containing protein n=1 Tax=Leyella stercorea TaxID=363265 RepID=UPI003A5C8820